MTYSDKYKIDTDENILIITKVVKDIAILREPGVEEVARIIYKNPSSNGKMLSKSSLLLAYQKLKKERKIVLSNPDEQRFFKNIKMKSIRTISGVTPVTVLTKPFPCPGKCIFCPNDVRMPKSYISSEPGAQRAEANNFDPYFQTFNRLIALRNIGHITDKVELIILGGTWTHYPLSYQIWFVKRCFEALNDFGKSKRTTMLKPKEKITLDTSLMEEIRGESLKKTYNQVIAKSLVSRVNEAQNEKASWQELFSEHQKNELAKTRCIGLVIETRPDEISEEEVIRIRKLGATKVQIGVQSLDDEVLRLNKRGHNADTTRKAFNILRSVGFKIHAHWMPNLYGSDPKKDLIDFKRLFSDPSIRPDELKIYPCSLIQSAELMKYYKEGKWRPYNEEELKDLLSDVMQNVPEYCRVTRMIRDIPGSEIVTGNKKTNFRQIVDENLKNKSVSSVDIRAREIRAKKVKISDLSLHVIKYETDVSEEYFMQYITEKNEIAAFLRLSLPNKNSFINELTNSSMVREIHVYGESLEIGRKSGGRAQHMGLGKLLIKKAAEITKEKGYKRISVISSVGTRKYYEKNGFSPINLENKKSSLYQHKEL